MKNFKLAVPIMFTCLLLSFQAKAGFKDFWQFTQLHYCSGCDLSGYAFPGNYANASLINSFARNSTFTAILYRVNFSGSIMSGAKLKPYWEPIIDIREANFTGVILDNALIEKADLSGANFKDADLSAIDFSHANLSGANFENANLNNAIIRHSNLIGAQLTEEQLKMVAVIECTVMPNGDLYGCEK